ncbi:MAG: S-layer homology domain-containing protein, partial [Oscillospiraceae bacterium]|nr:S-layer homology domain-containing protein [Oscillospiraceae bacterium]
MAKMKKILSLVLALCMCCSLFAVQAFADGEEGDIPSPPANTDAPVDYVAQIGSEKFVTLGAAVDYANNMTEIAELTTLADGVEIQLLKDFDFDSASALTISNDITISGAYTISRGSYTGTMFSVAAGASLTLTDVTLDGSNNWTFREAEFMVFVENGTKCPANSYYATAEEGAPVATAPMIVVNGTATLGNGATIQNNAGETLFKVNSGAVLETLDGSVITHNTRNGSHVVAEVLKGGTWNIQGGEISNTVGRGHGIVAEVKVGGEIYMNGGEIFESYGSDTNGSVFYIHGYMELNDGELHDNYALYSPANSNNGAIYVYYDGKFVMNGGKLYDNYGSQPSGIISNCNDANAEPNTILNGGTVINGISGTNSKGHDVAMVNPVHVTGNMIVGESRFYNDVIVDEGATFDAEDVYFHGWIVSEIGTQDYTGGGTIDADVTLYAGAEVVHHEGTWNGFVTVDAVGTGTTLTVKDGAVINGEQVRVLNSVSSGDYLNGEEAAAAQAAAYVEEDGANVEVPVLYYHRLTDAQKSAIVVTYDYNGGLDAQGWSGCQLTTAEEAAMADPQPTKPGYVLAGWVYASELDPESLSMAGTEDYNGEAIGKTTRLIAQWELDIPTYSVSWIDGSKTLQYVDGLESGDDIPADPADPTRAQVGNTAYRFIGWTLTEGTEGADGTIGSSDLVYKADYSAITLKPEIKDEEDNKDDEEDDDLVDIPDDNTPLAPVPEVFTDDHYAYVIGYPDGTVRPSANITRAEVATIFFRLLDDEVRAQFMTTENEFTDIADGAWYNTAISTMAAMGIVNGYEDGSFQPNKNITRAEFAAIAARFDLEANAEGNPFTDIAGHWAESEICKAANNGWVKGYEDGSFQPNEFISRAEAMTMLGRLLERGYEVPELSFTDSDSIPRWSAEHVSILSSIGVLT